MPTAFVTGATGFLGLNLVEALVAEDWKVIAIHREGSDVALLEQLTPHLAQADILDLPSLILALPEDVDAVFHLAGDITQWAKLRERQMNVNVLGTQNVLAAARELGARRFVHTSTWSTYGISEGTLSEDTPRNPKGLKRNYAKSKHLAEEAVRAAGQDGMDVVIMNPSHIVGRHDSGY